jgi:DNA polymerase I-like protein with 3'-5' exonuclease and polymerase domains
MEIVTAMFLSQDPVGIKELNEGFDFHGDNQSRLDLPERLHAKTFIFRLLFGGTAPAYSHDPVFSGISSSSTFWQDKIDTFYQKYRGVEQWHQQLMALAQLDGSISIPTGRTWKFEPYLKKGELVFPRTQILNYPVQGLGADLMTLARIGFYSKLKEENLSCQLISTIHDSILIDSPTKEVDKVVELLYNVWDELPMDFEQYFGIPFNIKTRVEVKVGPNWKDMTDYAD